MINQDTKEKQRKNSKYEETYEKVKLSLEEKIIDNDNLIQKTLKAVRLLFSYIQDYQIYQMIWAPDDNGVIIAFRSGDIQCIVDILQVKKDNNIHYMVDLSVEGEDVYGIQNDNDSIDGFINDIKQAVSFLYKQEDWEKEYEDAIENDIEEGVVVDDNIIDKSYKAKLLTLSRIFAAKLKKVIFTDLKIYAFDGDSIAFNFKSKDIFCEVHLFCLPPEEQAEYIATIVKDNKALLNQISTRDDFDDIFSLLYKKE